MNYAQCYTVLGVANGQVQDVVFKKSEPETQVGEVFYFCLRMVPANPKVFCLVFDNARKTDLSRG